METIECHTLYGKIKRLPAAELQFRPSVYGLVVYENTLLLARGRFTGRYALPGGGVELGERMEDALKRELREEAGIDIEVKEFLHFHEDFFYYDPLDSAIHGLLFYYWCAPRSLTLIEDALVDDLDVEQPRWIPIRDLAAASFQSHGATTIMLLEKILERR